MRSLHPIPGERWPHDMTITVEDGTSALFELLWVRDAWGLTPSMDDPPPPLADFPARVASALVDRAPIREWEAAWPRLWTDVLGHAAQETDHALVESLHHLPPGSPDRADLIGLLVGPTWREEFGDAALEPTGNSRFDDWNERANRRRVAEMRTRAPLREHDAVDALVPQWRRGLTRIVTIPCIGEHTRTIGPHALLVTDATREDHARYVAALGRFAPR